MPAIYEIGPYFVKYIIRKIVLDTVTVLW